MNALICRMRACRLVSGRTDDSQPSCSEKAAANRSSTALESSNVGAIWASVVESEITGCQRCLTVNLRHQAVAAELHAEFEVARIESPDGPSGAVDVDGATCDVADLHGSDRAAGEDPAECGVGPARRVERHEGRFPEARPGPQRRDRGRSASVQRASGQGRPARQDRRRGRCRSSDGPPTGRVATRPGTARPRPGQGAGTVRPARQRQPEAPHT